MKENIPPLPHHSLYGLKWWYKSLATARNKRYPLLPPPP